MYLTSPMCPSNNKAYASFYDTVQNFFEVSRLVRVLRYLGRHGARIVSIPSELMTETKQLESNRPYYDNKQGKQRNSVRFI